MATADWGRARTALRWCLIEGRDVNGRAEMQNALRDGDWGPRGMQSLLHGCSQCQKKNEEETNVVIACASENPRALFNIGREIMGWSHV